MALSKYLREKITTLSVAGTFATYAGAVAALDYFHKTYWSDPTSESVMWAATFAFFCYAFIGLLNYCCFSQMVLQEEVDRVAAVKSRLEKQVVKSRQSSKKRPSSSNKGRR